MNIFILKKKKKKLNQNMNIFMKRNYLSGQFKSIVSLNTVNYFKIMSLKPTKRYRLE